MRPFRRNRRPRPDDLMAVADAVQPPVDPSPDVYAVPRLVLDDVDVELGMAELAVSWELPTFRPPHERPPVIPGPRPSTEEH